MRRIVASLAAALTVAAATAWAVTPAGYSERLPVPPPGEVLAAQLSNGEPVFVVRHDEHDVSVLSAVSTHLEHVVAWCPAPGLFLEPLGYTRFDTRGRWLPGPAPSGLAPYQAELSEDGSSVAVGRLGDPVPRWERTDTITVGPGRDDCMESEGSVGGVFPPGTDPAAALRVGQLAGVAFGSFASVEGTIDLDSRPARLCAHAPDGRCPADSVRVLDFFWGEALGFDHAQWAHSVTGAFLVRRSGPGVVDRVAALVRLVGTPPDYRYSVTWAARDDAVRTRGYGEYAGLLERVSVAGDGLVLHAAGEFQSVHGLDGPPSPGLPSALDRVVLGGPLAMTLDRREAAPSNAFMPPGWLSERLAAEPGRVAVRFATTADGTTRFVRVYDTLRRALADY